jgi:hypothetical protein
MQGLIADLEAARRGVTEQSHLDDVARTPTSRHSSRKGVVSPAKSHASGGGVSRSGGGAALVVVEQLEELRMSHGRERVIKEKQLIQVCVVGGWMGGWVGGWVMGGWLGRCSDYIRGYRCSRS